MLAGEKVVVCWLCCVLSEVRYAQGDPFFGGVRGHVGVSVL